MATSLVQYIIDVVLKSEKAVANADKLTVSLSSVAATATVVAAGIAAVGASAVALANDITNTVDRINTLSMSSGLATSTIKGLELAAAASGKELRAILPPDFAKRVAEAAEGSGNAAKGFDRLGLSVKTSDGHVKSADRVFRELIDALGSVEDPTLRAAAAQEIFGNRSQELTSALADRGDLEAWIAMADRYGADVGPEAQQATAEWQRSMALLNLQVEGLKNNLIPLIEPMAKVVELAGVGADAYGKFMERMKADTESTIPVVMKFGLLEGGMAVWDAFWEWRDASQALSSALGTVNRDVSELTRTLGETSESDFAIFGPSLDDAGPSKEAIRKAKDAAAKAAKEAKAELSRQLGLAALEAGPGAGVTTLKLTTDIGDETQRLVDDLDSTFADIVANMEQVYADDREARKKLAEESERKAEEAAQRVNDDMNSTFSDGVGALSLAFGGIAEVAGIVGQAADMIGGITASIETLPDQFMALADAVPALIEAIAGLPAALIESAPDIALGIANAMWSVAVANFDLIGDTLAVLFDQLPGDIAAEIADVLRNIGQELNPFSGDSFLGFSLAGKGEKGDIGPINIPKFETGGEVTRTGLAYIHAGEYVVPAAERMAGGAAMGSAPTVNVYTTDARIAAREVSAAIGPYGIGARLGGVR